MIGCLCVLEGPWPVREINSHVIGFAPLCALRKAPTRHTGTEDPAGGACCEACFHGLGSVSSQRFWSVLGGWFLAHCCLALVGVGTEGCSFPQGLLPLGGKA